jgi:outer membrane protein OmpA-like peptidoglycan-associated protein
MVRIKYLLFSALLLTGMYSPLRAQETKYTTPSWWFGVAGAANVNFFNGSTQHLTNSFITPVPFHSGLGVGLYAAPLVEYHSPNSRWGVMLQAGYDGRNGIFKQVYSPCNCPRDLKTDLGYITIEPSLRFAPMKQGLYIYAGPRVAFNIMKSFTFQEKPNPAYPNQEVDPTVTGSFSDIRKVLVSMQVGVGYDIMLSNHHKMATQFMLSPFVSFQPYIGQAPRSTETWTVNTLRAGLALKIGRGHKVTDLTGQIQTPKPIDAALAVMSPDVLFVVNSPKNIPSELRVRETFPLRNYVFFDAGSTKIPSRYALLTNDQVAGFAEDQLETRIPKNVAGRSSRQMIVYYNILNIVGDRMVKKPQANINLRGSSNVAGPDGAAEGRAMAESIKQYLVTVYRIDPIRITTVGAEMPRKPSGGADGSDQDLRHAEDRRVLIGSNSPAMMMEFQSGPTAPLKPLEMNTVLDPPLSSYVSFDISGNKEIISPWSLIITDDKGVVQNFGPYVEEKVSMPGIAILGDRAMGDFKVVMTGKTPDGKTVSRDTSIHMALWAVPMRDIPRRYSVIFDYDESHAVTLYEKYLTEIVAPKIPVDSKVIVHGYTDILGNPDHNLELSRNRANEVRGILTAALSAAGRKDVTFDVAGYGADTNKAPFENKFPEQRFYNRTVVIDIIPAK